MVISLLERLFLPSAFINPPEDFVIPGSNKKWGLIEALFLLFKALITQKIRLIWSPPQTEILVYSRKSLPHVETLLTNLSFEVMDTNFKGELEGTVCLAALLRAIRVKKSSLPRTLPLWERYVANYVERSQCAVIISAVDERAPLTWAAHLLPSVRRIVFQVSGYTGAFSFAESGKFDPADVVVVWSDEYLHQGEELGRPGSSSHGSQPGFFSLGSIKSNQVPISPESPIEGLLFISQWRPYFVESFFQLESKIFSFLENWCAERGIELFVLLCSIDDAGDEIEFYEALGAGNMTRYIQRSRDWKSSFSVVDRFSIVVTVSSSLGLEALGRGKKTLFFFDHRIEFPRYLSPTMLKSAGGPYWVSDGNIERFRQLLNKVFSTGGKEFFELSKVNKALVPPYDTGLKKTRALVRQEIVKSSS